MQIGFLVFFNVYCFTNSTNHTGFDMRFWMIVFSIFSVSLLLTMKLRQSSIRHNDPLIVAMSVVALLTAVNMAAFDYFNIMLEYDTWCQKRMPPKPF